MIINSRQEASKSGEVGDQLFCPWSDLVPHWIELPAHDSVEGSEVCVIYIEIIKVEL